ncbi:hypothetical protein D1007_10189 [Hordeum vulgare]|nr:hypothetical protein D1007_10189 [Hordeum vulgare]
MPRYCRHPEPPCYRPDPPCRRPDTTRQRPDPPCRRLNRVAAPTNRATPLADCSTAPSRPTQRRPPQAAMHHTFKLGATMPNPYSMLRTTLSGAASSSSSPGAATLFVVPRSSTAIPGHSQGEAAEQSADF